MWRNMKFPHMWHVCDIKMSTHMWNLSYFVIKSVFLQFTQFYRETVVSWFTHFCVEKNLSKNCISGEKMTNMRSASPLFNLSHIHNLLFAVKCVTNPNNLRARQAALLLCWRGDGRCNCSPYSFKPLPSDLIFVTSLTSQASGEKICHVEKFQLSMHGEI